jgi:hypothetical protein
MKKSPATTFLLIILVASALLSVFFCGLYIRNAVRLRDLQRSMSNAQNYRALFVSLVNDSMEYSKKNSAIDPILEAAGVKASRTAAAVSTNKPAGK